MTESSRRATRLSLLSLGAAMALGLAGCNGLTNSSSGGKINNLSDLPNKDQSMLKLGDASRAAGDCSAALRFYQLVLDNKENEAEAVGAHVGLASCQFALGNLPEAEGEYEAAAKLAPQDPAPLLGLGRLKLVQHDPGKAVQRFDQAIQLGAGGPQVWNDKGVAYDQLRLHSEAQETYRSGLRRYPNDRALRNNLALSLALTRDFGEAESLLRALAAEPQATARTRQNLALVLGLAGKGAEAREVSRNDLDGAALDNNGYFYDYARATITGGPAPPPPPHSLVLPSSQQTSEASRPHAGGPPLPPAVMVQARPAEPNRTAALIDKRAQAALLKAMAAEPTAAETAPPESPPPPPAPAVAPIAALEPPQPLTAGGPVAASEREAAEKESGRPVPVAATQPVAVKPRAPGPVASSETE